MRIDKSLLKNILEKENLSGKVDAIHTDELRDHRCGAKDVLRNGYIRAKGLDWKEYLMYHNIEVNDEKLKEWKTYHNKKEEEPKVINNQNNNINKQQVNKEIEIEQQQKIEKQKQIKKKIEQLEEKKKDERKNKYHNYAYIQLLLEKRLKKLKNIKQKQYNTKNTTKKNAIQKKSLRNS